MNAINNYVILYGDVLINNLCYLLCWGQLSDLCTLKGRLIGCCSNEVGLEPKSREGVLNVIRNVNDRESAKAVMYNNNIIKSI